MADGEIRGLRKVLPRGMVYIGAEAFWHPRLRDHIGKVVDVYSHQPGSAWVRIRNETFQLLIIPPKKTRMTEVRAMTSGEIRVWRPVLNGGVVMLFGNGFEHRALADHAGEVVDVHLSKDSQGEVSVQADGKRIFLQPIADLVDGVAFH